MTRTTTLFHKIIVLLATESLKEGIDLWTRNTTLELKCKILGSWYHFKDKKVMCVGIHGIYIYIYTCIQCIHGIYTDRIYAKSWSWTLESIMWTDLFRQGMNFVDIYYIHVVWAGEGSSIQILLSNSTLSTWFNVSHGFCYLNLSIFKGILLIAFC